MTQAVDPWAESGPTPRLDGFCALAGLAGAVAATLLLPTPDGVFAAVFAFLAAWIFRSDCRDFLIPDMASTALAALGLFRAALLGVEALSEALACGLGGFALVAALYFGYRRWRGDEGLGFGDVKLAGACALWLDPASAATALELAALAGLLWLWTARQFFGAAEDDPLPFGAVLAPAALLVFCLGGAA
jgi:prepilin signal peptidase PulO-like enzyme (type II secretory pathway)